jgi:hypothetical protein
MQGVLKESLRKRMDVDVNVDVVVRAVIVAAD